MPRKLEKPNVKLKNLNNGAEAKKEIQAMYTSKNIYQDLKNAVDMLEYDTSLVLKGSVSDERQHLITTIQTCLKKLERFYTADGEGLKRLGMEDSVDQSFASTMLDVEQIFTKVLPDAIKEYREHIAKKDDYVKKQKEGQRDYKTAKVDTDYIFRHVACDTVEGVLSVGKDFMQKATQLQKLVKNNNITDFTIEDVLHGRDAITKKMADTHVFYPEQADKKLETIKDLMKQFSESGNLAARNAYQKLLNIDLSGYYMNVGNGYNTLDPEQIKELDNISKQIDSVTKDFLEQAKAGSDDELNARLAPETANMDGQFTNDAVEYRKNLTSVFRELDGVSKQLADNVKKASKHPELFTMQVLAKGEREDSFLDNLSVDKQLDILLGTMKYTDEKVDSNKQLLAYNNIKKKASKLMEDVSTFYGVGVDGYYAPIMRSNLAEVQKKFTELEKAIADNEKNFLENTASAASKTADTAIKNLKSIITKQKKDIDNMLKQTEKYSEFAHENITLSLAEVMDPNPRVRNDMKKVRENKINDAYAQDQKMIKDQLVNPLINAAREIELRTQLISRDRFFSIKENKEKYKEVFEKNKALVDKINHLYERDAFGGFTHYSTEAEKQDLVNAMFAANKSMQDLLDKEKKSLTDTAKENLAATVKVIGDHAAVLDKATIAGKHSLSEIMDHDKFGNASLQDTLASAQGYDRFDWTETDQKNAQEMVMYGNYINPFKKMKEDLAKLKYVADTTENIYTADEKKWLQQISDYMTMNFDQNFQNKYFGKKKQHDDFFGIDLEVVPVMTPEDQHALAEKFGDFNNFLTRIAQDENFKNCQNKNFRAFMDGIALFGKTTEHRLSTFNTRLDLPVFTVQEAISGRADTSLYNFRNELERFTRLHSKTGMVDKLSKAGILLSNEQKFEMENGEIKKHENGQPMRKREETTVPWYRRWLVSKDADTRGEYINDYNDLTYYLDMLREFENDYFRCDESGMYRDLMRTGKRVLGGTLIHKINSVEDLQYVYEQVQGLANVCKIKAETYNEKNPKDPIPQEYIDSMENLRWKGVIGTTLVATNQAQFTKPDSINVMELMHSDPEKRRNMWTVRMNGIFHANRQEEGQTGTYRNLEHFQTEKDSEETYNGRFYNLAEILPLSNPKGTPENKKKETLSDRLDKLVEKHFAEASEEAKNFAKELVKNVAADPDGMSALLPTSGEVQKDRLNNVNFLAQAAEAGKVSNFKWWEKLEDKAAVQELLSDMSRLGLNHADAEERKLHGVKYGVDVTLNPVILSNLSEILTGDKPTDYPYDRLIPKAQYRNITVPGDKAPDNAYDGIMVDATPDRVMDLDPREQVDGIQQTNYFKVITGKDILMSNDPQNYSLQQFNNPEMIRDLANLQALCYLVNAPLPKVEDLKFAQIPTNESGTEWKARLMSFEPHPAFVSGKDFPGKIKLEDLSVVSGKLGEEIRNLYNKDKEVFDKSCRAWAKSNLIKNLPPNYSEETVNQMVDMVTANVKEMSRFLANPEKTRIGAIKSESGSECKHFKNGIRDGQILITDDFKNLTVDKMSLKKSIFASKDPEDQERKGINLFTEISDIPERRYLLQMAKDPESRKVYGRVSDQDKATRCYDGIMRELNRLNVERVLADFATKKDEYFGHKNSQEAKDVMKACEAIYKLQTTGEVSNYETRTGSSLSFGVKPGKNVKDVMGALDNLQKFLNDVQGKLSDYAEAKKGITGIHWRSFGRVRLRATNDLNESLTGISARINGLADEAPRFTDDPLLQEAIGKANNHKKVNILKQDEMENANKRQRRNSIVKNSNLENKKEGDVKDDVKVNDQQMKKGRGKS